MSCNFLFTVLCIVLILGSGWQSCHGSGTFGYDVHHRFSDTVKGILAVDEFLPEMDSPQYYSAMAHRDRVLHGRRLSSTVNQSHLSFLYGNETFRINSLGFLHYANVSVGTPGLSFLVALDTGSNLFWLPCDCTSCVHGLVTSTGRIDLNIYSPNVSSTSTTIPCNNTMCQYRTQCLAAELESCPYKVEYLSNNTSSTGILVDDLLHLTTDDGLKSVDAPITFGCGMIQTGSFLTGGAPNGLFGLGIKDVSVPSTLAAKGLASNSFSLCFGHKGMGRITFGDKGSSDQGETPFNIMELHPSYNVTITEINVGVKTSDVSFNAIFDSGTSFTYLNDPAYTAITTSFDSQVTEKRTQYNLSIPFEFCYDISSTQVNISTPIVNLTMAGGDSFFVTDPLVIFKLSEDTDTYLYCLAILKSDNVDIIGQNFMTGYRIIFNREKMVLGWKESNCYDESESSTPPINRTNSTADPPTVPVTPHAPLTPQASEGPRSGLSNSGTSPLPPSSDSSKLGHITYTFMIILFAVLVIF